MDPRYIGYLERTVLILLGLACFVQGTDRQGQNPFNDAFLRRVLARARSWKPDTNFRSNIHYHTFRSLKGIGESRTGFKVPIKHYDYVYDIDIPESFDSRDHWPNCDSLREIRNQGTCGSCWAVAAASVMSDRVCIHTNGTRNVAIAAEDLMGCCADCGNGCEGGFLDGTSFQYWVDAGLVSGGAYNSTEGCKPYPFKPCLYPFTDCHREESPKCRHHCHHGVDKRYARDKVYGSVAYSVPRDERVIRYEIMTNGPVEGGFDVYEDVFLYKSGVYRHVYGELVGKHAVRIIGWGREGGIPYWLISNSYGEDWGDHGYFKMVRGINHLGIESKVITGLPLV
ncbi:cathepsin B-like [Anopheles albimanus]|uniref:Peptidase C1A papain C-terminal domain-containing protein n=1 Tax=Anopheles albimanus TaxID=7167 RepID=A0A182F913_ANOAL|nr:cathepsin B-like [Anopheles albimanus]